LCQRRAWASRITFTTGLSAPTHSRPLLPAAFESLSLLVPRFHTLVVRSASSRWLIHLCLYRKKINLSTCLAGQAVGIKEVDNGIWLVSFMQYDLGYIDLEEKTLQPLENPFGPKVLLMS
jgi:hypothetical protein